MKISEAMRKGAKMGPQLFGTIFGQEVNRHDLSSCAFGAYWLGIGKSVNDRLVRDDSIDPLFNQEVCCPVKQCPGCSRVDLLNIVIHLNDHHRWTRECIAGWIEVTYEGGIPSKEIMELIGEPEKTRELVCIRPNPKPKGE